MPLFVFHNHVHVHGNNQPGDIATEFLKLKQFMSEQTDALKTQIADTNTKLDSAGTVIAAAATGLKTDLDTIKQKLADLGNGATPAEIAEVAALVSGTSTRADNVVSLANALKTLDEETV